ncbi:Amidase signature domain containing protein [Elaphomyces granulatus]
MATCATKTDWSLLVSEKRSSNLAKIPLEWRLSSGILDTIDEKATISVLDVPGRCGILTEVELELTEKYDATDLTRMMIEGKAKSEDVVRGFCKRAAIAHQLTNCLTEIMFEEAIARAKELDEYLLKEGKPMGPLHGLPVSLKDSFNVKGAHATIGYVKFLENSPASHNSAIVEILLKLGAVPYVKTNLPQTMMSADSDNYVFGRTLNPNKLCLTAGGSTGGEGALIKMRGSILGVGTDIAGSIRIPALCNGIMGLQPSASRIPWAGATPPGRFGSPSTILPVIGPEGHSVRDLELFMKSVIDTDPWLLDANILSVPWRSVSPPRRSLNLGFITEDREHRPLHPSQLRMITTLIKTLQGVGHSLISLDDKVPSVYETSILAWKHFLLDPEKTPLKIMKAGGESAVKSLLVTRYPELQGWEASLDELWDMNVERAKITKIYHDLVIDNELDAILLPTYQATAVPHDTYGLVPYTVLANFLGYPSVALPFLHASKEADKPFIRSGVTYIPPYEPDLVEGVPCGFQIMCRPMRDEELIKIAELIVKTIT